MTTRPRIRPEDYEQMFLYHGTMIMTQSAETTEQKPDWSRLIRQMVSIRLKLKCRNFENLLQRKRLCPTEEWQPSLATWLRKTAYYNVSQQNWCRMSRFGTLLNIEDSLVTTVKINGQWVDYSSERAGTAIETYSTMYPTPPKFLKC